MVFGDGSSNGTDRRGLSVLAAADLPRITVSFGFLLGVTEGRRGPPRDMRCGVRSEMPSHGAPKFCTSRVSLFCVFCFCFV